MAHPLSKEDLEQINASLKGIEETKKVLARAKIANIDVSEQEAQADEAEKQLKAIKLGFFPSGRA